MMIMRCDRKRGCNIGKVNKKKMGGQLAVDWWVPFCRRYQIAAHWKLAGCRWRQHHGNESEWMFLKSNKNCAYVSCLSFSHSLLSVTFFFSRVVSHLLQRNIHNTHAHDARRHSRVDNFPWRVRSTVALRLTLLLRFTWLKSTKKMNVAAIYHDKLQCARQMLFFVIWFVSFWFSIACQQIPHPSSWCSYSFVFFVVCFV